MLEIALPTTVFNFQGVAGSEVRGATQPAGQHRFLVETSSPSGKNDKDGLSYFLRQMRIAHLSQRCGMDECNVAIDELRERGLRMVGSVLGQELGIALHLTY